jgi:dTDP-4-dehydrorhamnose reductase
MNGRPLILLLGKNGQVGWELQRSLARTVRAVQPHEPWSVRTIDAVPTHTFPTPAQRPHNSRLNTEFLHATFGLHLPHWQVGVGRMLAEVL